MPTSLAGSRIRAARRRAGITQARLAQIAGISPSYLNLIEHNRRRIGGAVLNAIAEALGTRAAELSEGGNPTAVADLRAMAAENTDARADPATAEALVGRFPEWAELLVSLSRKLRDQSAVIGALSDRLTHDPFLSENVHAMLSHITAIRSTAGILTQMADIPPEQRARFHASVHSESEQLSDTAQQLADYLGSVASQTGAAATTEESLDHFLTRNAFHFEALDREAEATLEFPEPVAQQRLGTVIGDILDADPGLATGPARALAERHLRGYAGDARAMPLHAFAEKSAAAAYDPATLAQGFGQPIPAIFRRLAVLRRPLVEAPRFGLIVVTASGYPLLRQPLPSFALPRHGNACPVWPLFQSFARPGQPMLDAIRHDNGRRYVTLTHAAPRHEPAFGARPDLAAAMLFVAEEDSPYPLPGEAPRPVGTSCRICPRGDCPARAEAQLLT